MRLTHLLSARCKLNARLPEAKLIGRTEEQTKRGQQWHSPSKQKLSFKVSVETIADWGTAFATASESRDPNRIHQMLEVLMEDPLRSQGSFIDSSRLYMLQGGIAQQEWRVAELLHRLVDFMRPYLSHPYQVCVGNSAYCA